MRALRSRGVLVTVAVLGLGLPSAWLLTRDAKASDTPLVARVKRGVFKVMVTTSGELKARKFVQISAPPNSQQAEAYQMKIASIVPEGTIVKEGDVVAEIDRSGLANKMAEVSLALQKAEAVQEQARLDSTLNLSKAREEIRTMELGLEEKRLAKEQATYEAPTVKRQAEIDLEKAQRALVQAKTDYKTKTEQAQAKMREVGTDFERQRNKLKIVEEVMQGFTIRAPAPGMVIYVKEWNGKKRTTGSQVSPWEPSIATLPDLTQMESITYVNEIDVRKVAVGQPVVVTLDADPSKKLTGVVTAVANMGEQRPNTDAKVFEVKLTIEQADTTLRPGMTTGNSIQTQRTESALFIPLEALANENGTALVYKTAGGRVTKQEVRTGAMSDDEVVIAEGLREGDQVLLSPPTDRDGLTLARLSGHPAPVNPPRGDTTKPSYPLSSRTDSTKPSPRRKPPAR